MSYRITYGTDKQITTKNVGKKQKKVVVAAVISIVLVMIARFMGIGEAMWHWLLPGNPAVTESALISAWSRLECGSSAADAFAVFCQEILDGAQITESD